ncbi:MAG: ABC transporter permease [Candidatus Methanomethylophilaceae archaeon]|nr:ABC transporter permease [Candidatus Methanomethylophilaceae archaeon]
MEILSKTVEKMSSYTTNSDIKQVFAVMENEIVKFLRGKKIYIYLAIIGLLMALDIGISLMVENSDGVRMSITQDGDAIARSLLGNLYLVLIIMATLFTAGAICSEFEERTALILLTKPIRRPTIVFGKFLASFAVGFATILLYLIVAIFFKAVGNGHIDGDLFAGMGVYLIYIMAITGVAMLVSAFAKKSSTSALLTLFMLLILPLILEAILGIKGFDTWFLLGSLGGAGADVISGGGEPLRDIAAMLVWLIVTMAGSIVLFKKRQF